MIPILPGLAVYALAFGAAAAGRGLSLVEATAMSAFVYAGASQMVALEVWQPAWSAAALLTVALVTATVNARFALMGASIQPWLRGAPPVRTTLGLFFLVDSNWIIATRYREEGGRDLGVFFGAGILCWLLWVGATIPGYLAGSLVADPKRYALDLVMPVFFGAMAVSLWRGVKASALPWAVAAIVALMVQALVPGYLFIVAGALAGALTGALTGDE
jgi:predicted branched-subunit amino acid permease